MLNCALIPSFYFSSSFHFLFSRLVHRSNLCFMSRLLSDFCLQRFFVVTFVDFPGPKTQTCTDARRGGTCERTLKTSAYSRSVQLQFLTKRFHFYFLSTVQLSWTENPQHHYWRRGLVLKKPAILNNKRLRYQQKPPANRIGISRLSIGLASP